MAAPQETLVRRRRGWRILAWTALGLATVLGVAGSWAYRYYADPQRVSALVAERITRTTTGRVRIGSATFSLFDGVHLRDLSVSEPDAATDERPVFQCPEVIVRHDLLAALVGRFRARSVTLQSPMLTVAVDPETGGTNLDALIEGFKRRKRPRTPSRPVVEARDGRVRLVRASTPDRAVEELSLSVRARPTPTDADVYDIVWQELREAQSAGHAQVHVRNGTCRNVRGGSPTVSVDTVLTLAEGRFAGAAERAKTLGLKGSVRLRDYDLVLRKGADESQQSAVIDVSEVYVSVPASADERAKPADERYLQFTQLAGEIHVAPTEIRARLQGALGGAQCSIEAISQRGAGAAVENLPLDVQAEVTGLQLPRIDDDAPAKERGVIEALPALQRVFTNYDPHGRVDLHVEASKPAGASEKFRLNRLVATARGGDASVRYFPYRADQLTGAVEYTPDGVWIRDLCGQHEGGRVCVVGHFEKPDRCAAGDLQIAAEDVPIDQELYNGLGARYQEVLAPFQLRGRIDVNASLRRDPCEGDSPARWSWSSTVGLDDVAATHAEFPYPIENLRGNITIQPHRIEIVDVAGKAEGADIGITGEVLLSPGAPRRVNVTVSTHGATFDELTLAALPANIRKQIVTFQPSGPFDLRANFQSAASGEGTVSHTRIDLQGITIRHQAFPIELSDVVGLVRIGPEGVEAPSLTARFGDARLDITGRTLGTGDVATADFSIHAQNLRLDDELRQAAPVNVRDAIKDWTVLDPLEASIVLRSQAGDERLDYRIDVALGGVRVKHADFPIPFSDVHGGLRVDLSGVRANGLRARYGNGELKLDLDARHSPHLTEGTVVLSAKGLALDEGLRDALPSDLRRSWSQAAPSGTVDLRLHDLHFRKAAGEPRTTWTVDGRVDLHDVSLPGLGKLNGLRGVWTGRGAVRDATGGTMLNGRLQLSEAEVQSRRLTDIKSQWSFVRAADGQGRFGLDDAHASLYDGMAGGKLELVAASGQSHYNASVTIHGLQLGPFVDAGRTLAATGDDANPVPGRVRGTVDAYVYVAGETGDPLSRRGGGQIEISEGHIYRLPILLAILNVLRMSPPEESVLHEAEAVFYVTGNKITFEDLELRGGILALVGSGSMSIPDQAVDLRLVNMGSHHISRIPVLADVVEGASREIVELRVTGPLSRPSVRAQPLRGLTDELRKLFQKKPKKKIPPAP